MNRLVLSLCISIASAAVSSAAVVSVLNATESEIIFSIEHSGNGVNKVALPAGRTTALTVGREPVIRVSLNGKPAAYKLDPYTPYLFVADEKGNISFSGVELAAKLPKPDDVPADPPLIRDVSIPVTLFSDTSNPFLDDERERIVRDRFAKASKILQEQAGVRFKLVGVRDWETEKEPMSLADTLVRFIEAGKIKNGKAVGFLNRPVKGDEILVQPAPGHAVMREMVPRLELERVEVLTHLMANWVGAVRAADGGSVMRSQLGDGKAAHRDWVIQFDPHNLIVMHIWVEELAAGRKNPEEFSAKARARLAVLYQSVAEIHKALKSDDVQARDMAAAMSRALPERPEVEDPNTQPVQPVVSSNLTPDEQAVKAVVRAVKACAEQLASDRKNQPTGDELTALYVRAAAEAALQLDEKRRARAFLFGLGIALDDSTTLRDKPVIKKVCLAAESDVEREDRLKVLGRPTVRGRRDLCQHFAISAALTEMFGAAAAEFAGMSKELRDMKGGSGFSFTDLAADLAGIRLAKEIAADSKRLGEVAKQFLVEDYVPEICTFPEGLTEKDFKTKYGSTDDARFKAELETVRKAVASVAAFRK